MGPTSRVVILIDMDCFYCQVEEKLNPALKGKPIAVVQYNAWRGGGIIAVNYLARDQGVTRHMRGFEAKKKCPSIILVQVPELRGKADLTKYRDAGKHVADVLATFTPLLQRASVDEAYLDITELVEKRIETSLNDLHVENLSNTHVVGYDLKDFLENVITNKEFAMDNLKLAMGGLIAEEIRHEVFIKTGYKCSAGIAHNKILAKLVCSLHKPDKQTILPQDTVPIFFQTMPIRKIKNLGGKFGQTLTDDFQITYMGQLAKIPEKDLAKKYDEKMANWLYNISRGIDMEPVTTKLISKSIACCKNFPGPSALTTFNDVGHWLNKLGAEMSERLKKDLKENNRKAKQLIISFSQELNKKEVSSSRTHPLTSYETEKITQIAFTVIKKFCQRPDNSCHIKFLGLSAGHFEDVRKIREITSFFQTGRAEGKQIVKNCDTHEINSECQDNNLQKEDVDDNVYNQVTQELEENAGNLVFYDELHRVTINKDNLFNESTYEGFAKCDKTKNSFANIGHKFPSFFSKYFDVSPEQESQRFTDISPLHENEETYAGDEQNRVCNECQKNIPVSEFQSHQDYHFALKISESEKNIACPSEAKTSPKVPMKKQKSKGIKRKAESNNTLEIFLKKEDDSDFTDTCSECNKKIKIEEISSHMDYHVAKKIHQEINKIQPFKPPGIPKVGPEKTKSQSSIRNLKSYFT